MTNDISKKESEFDSQYQSIVGRNLVYYLIPPISCCVVAIVLFCCLFREEFNIELSIFSATIALLHGFAIWQFYNRKYSEYVVVSVNFFACICYLAILTYSFTITPELERGRGIALLIVGAGLVLTRTSLFIVFTTIAVAANIAAFQFTGIGISGRDVLYVCLMPMIIGYFACISRQSLFSQLDRLFAEKKQGAIKLQIALNESREELRLRKEIDSKLAHANQSFDRLINVIPQVHWVRKENEIVFVSPSYEKIWESKCEELYADANTFLAKVHPDDLNSIGAAIETCFETGEFDQEYRIVMSDGRIKWIHARSYVDPDDNLTEYGIAEDITRKKDINESILKKNLQLRSTIESLQSETDLRQKIEAENEAFQEKLSHAQRLESLSLLAGGIAHDFNNILMAILINIDLLKIDIEQEMLPDLNRVEDIEKASTRAAEICKQMLQFSGRVPTELQKIDLADQFSDAIQILHSIIPQNVIVDFDKTDADFYTLGTAAQVQQVALNLLSNAIEAVGDTGKIELSLSTGTFDSKNIESTYLDTPSSRNEFHVIVCKDNGCGMEKNTLKRLFDPFFSSKKKGRGLGLASVLGIVKGHGGTITVDSEVGVGTEFRVYLPAYSGESEELTGKAASSYVNKILT